MPKKLVYTKKLGRAVAEYYLTRTHPVYHVIHSLTGKWSVVPRDSKRALRSFSLRQTAINFAKKKALANSSGEVIIHEKNGSVHGRIAI